MLKDQRPVFYVEIEDYYFDLMGEGRLWTSDRHGALRIFDIEQASILTPPLRLNPKEKLLAVSPLGDFLVFQNQEGVFAWNNPWHPPAEPIALPSGPVHRLQFSPDGQWMATLNDDECRLIHRADLQVHWHYSGAFHKDFMGRFLRVFWGQDLQSMVLASHHEIVKISLNPPQIVELIEAPNFNIGALATTPSLQPFWILSTEGWGVFKLDKQDSDWIWNPLDLEWYMHHVACHASGRVYWASMTGDLWSMDPQSQQLKHLYQTPPGRGWVKDLELAPNQHHLLVQYLSGALEWIKI